VRRIEVVAPSFATVPWMLPHTTRLAVMHDRLARAFAQTLPLKICPLPFPMPTMHEMAQFHSMRDTDEALKWLVRKLRDLAKSGD
jgi:DNA-binding transcriptional LysR family regulator